MVDAVRKPDVTVVVPVFNRLRLLKATVESLRSQTMQSVEFLLVDDESDSDTFEYLTSLPVSDKRFRIIRKPEGVARGGQTSRNWGLKQAAADVIMFFDSDDLLAPACIADRYNHMQRHPQADIVVGRQAILDEARCSLVWENVYREGADELDRFLNLAAPLDVPWANGSVLIRTSRLIACDIQWIPHLLWQDVVFHFQCMAAGFKVVWMEGNAPDSFRRKHDEGHFGQILMTPGGMNGIVAVLAWMKTRLAETGQLTGARGRLLEKAFFHTCVLRAIDGNQFRLARELLEEARVSELISGDARMKMSVYMSGRRATRPFRRATYYWNRLAALTSLRGYYPSQPSTYATLEVQAVTASQVITDYGLQNS
jgi:hypothetical protein